MPEQLRIDRPPIHELALSAQFEPIPGLSPAVVGSLWQQHFRARFPKTEHHPPMASVTEDFSGQLPSPAVRLRLRAGLPPVRVWLVDSHGHELVQIQSDRFARNWRRVEDRGDYPSYHAVSRGFRDDLERFRVGIAEEDLGDLIFNHCEITYVNHFTPAQGFESHGHAHKVIAGLRYPNLPDGVLAESSGLRLSYVLCEAPSTPWARVHFKVDPAFRTSDGVPVLIVECTARGFPLGDGCEGIMVFLDRAHDALIELFRAVIAPEIQSALGVHRDA